MDVREELERAKNEVARLERIVATRPCAEVGHRWKHIGGSNAGCEKDCACSIPVYTCEVCKDCDYGENEEAREVRADCAERREWL